MTRSKLQKGISPKDFKAHYWLKEELIDFCRIIGINTSGGKIEISNSVISYLETGIVIPKSEKQDKTPKSDFDWNTETLSLETVISDSYKNTENVRAFFKQLIGSNFKFNVTFMDWMKMNSGKTLGDAVDKYREIALLKKDKIYRTEIAPQFEYNTYIRDFLTNNPDRSMKDAVKSWRLKRENPGLKKYNRTDLDFLQENYNTVN